MKIDFHFYTIYTLCKHAGIKEKISKEIAYSSQHVDDAKYDHELFFENGGRFKQQMSAHKFLDLNVFRKEVGYDIFLPFHFLPGGKGEEFYDKLICRENSEIAKQMLEDTLLTIKKPYGIHRLGITFHVYADTWSHQNFHGLQKEHNDVDELNQINDDFNFLEDAKSRAIPPIGHGKALSFPDMPFLKWSYKRYSEDDPIKINNLNRCIDAAKNIYDFICNKVYENRKDIFESEPKDWSSIEDKLMEVFSEKNSIDERIESWERKLDNGFFGFHSNISYDDREWFKEAVEVSEKFGKENYYKKSDFNKSNWKYFHDAVTYHSFFIKHELLPQYGIIT